MLLTFLLFEASENLFLVSSHVKEKNITFPRSAEAAVSVVFWFQLILGQLIQFSYDLLGVTRGRFLLNFARVGFSRNIFSWVTGQFVPRTICWNLFPSII
jgi:hypothetical protein